MKLRTQKILNTIELIRARHHLAFMEIELEISRNFILNGKAEDVYEKSNYLEKMRTLPSYIEHQKQLIKNLSEESFENIKTYNELREIL